MGKGKKQKSKEPKVSEEIKNKFIKYLKKSENLELVFKKRRQMCTDANANTFDAFVNGYWWKKLNTYLSGKYWRDIKGKWENGTKDGFYNWYFEKIKKGCKYCTQDGLIFPLTKGNFPEKQKGKLRRFLEVDRLNNNNEYEELNCVLACYPCNNAKSNIFDKDEFIVIGEAIKKVWKEHEHELYY